MMIATANLTSLTPRRITLSLQHLLQTVLSMEQVSTAKVLKLPCKLFLIQGIHSIDGVETFFAASECQNKNRNLVLHKIVGDEITKYSMPKRYEGKKGIWLIGYDGDDKAYSRDLSLLNQLYDLIDAMPVRQNEMLRQASSCD